MRVSRLARELGEVIAKTDYRWRTWDAETRKKAAKHFAGDLTRSQKFENKDLTRSKETR